MASRVVKMGVEDYHGVDGKDVGIIGGEENYT
jgi:hypothetical protein